MAKRLRIPKHEMSGLKAKETAPAAAVVWRLSLPNVDRKVVGLNPVLLLLLLESLLT